MKIAENQILWSTGTMTDFPGFPCKVNATLARCMDFVLKTMQLAAGLMRMLTLKPLHAIGCILDVLIFEFCCIICFLFLTNVMFISLLALIGLALQLAFSVSVIILVLWCKISEYLYIKKGQNPYCFDWICCTSCHVS